MRAHHQVGKVPETGKSSRDFDWTRDFRMNERLGALRESLAPMGIRITFMIHQECMRACGSSRKKFVLMEKDLLE